ncbi:hypothetical protein CEB3_c46120 [Peptococcaceae bacterium CEB3]|nr:hypothetical protein CEB3_c46120 [Peptococcaceae bacterium CEB3]
MGFYTGRPYRTQGPPSYGPPSQQSVSCPQVQPPRPRPSLSGFLWLVQFYWLFWLALSFLLSFALSNAFWGGL